MAHRRSRVSHAKEAFYIVSILIALLIGLFSIFGPSGYLDMKKKQAELENQRKINKAHEESIQTLRRSVESLRNDALTIERIAREKGYGRKGEIVLEVPEAQSDQAPPSGTKSLPRRK